MSEDIFVAAWRSNSVARESSIDEVTRELSKTGSLGSFEEILSCLSRHLSRDEVLALYESLQQSRRPESEWRDEFLAIFSTLSSIDLPKPIVDEEAAQRFEEEAHAQQESEQIDPGYPEVPF